MAYPKLAAALDDLLSRFVRDHAEDAVLAFIASQYQPEVVAEKSVDIPVSTGEEAKL